jgi:L-lactate dehydrogenase complex protein LldE
VTLPARQPVKASLFATCIIDQLYPDVGVSVVRVLRRQGVSVDFPPGQTCCGQPLYNSGFTREARRLARRVLDSFAASQYVVVPSGSCAAMLRVFYLELLAEEPALFLQAEELAAKTYEFSEFLVAVLEVEDIPSTYRAKATYHPSCHLLRELGVREAPARLLAGVGGLDLTPLPQAETCCGFGGTFSVKYPHISEGMVADKISNVTSTGADTLVSCDMSCLMNIGGGLARQGSGIQVKHLAQILEGEKAGD